MKRPFNEKTILTKCLTCNQHLVGSFTKFWHLDYLASLHERSQSSNVTSSNTVEIGDIIEIHRNYPHVFEIRVQYKTKTLETIPCYPI
jgi:hypothetical protein